MGKTKFEYRTTPSNKKKIIKPSNLTRTNRKTPRIQFNHAFNFFPEPDNYCFQIPDNYMDKENFPEDAEIKESFIRDMLENSMSKEKLIVGELNGICKEQHTLTQNLQMQTTGSMVLYIENKNDVKAAATVTLDFFEKDYEEDEEEEEEEPYKIENIRILTFCSKEPKYGTKLMNKIIDIFYVGIDNGYILDDAKIELNYTPSSKPFYKKLGFDCTDTHNKLCSFSQVMERPNFEARGKTTGRKTKRNNKSGKTTQRRRSKK
jgi:hypothetical protein